MRNSKGFTLIELLIVVVIIGILAAIAIPKFGATKDKAYVAAMKSDLRNLVTAEESYFSDNVAYTTTFGSGVWSQTQGVVVTIATVGTGWAATANHTALNPAKPCYIIGGGNTTANNLATTEGEVKCTP